MSAQGCRRRQARFTEKTRPGPRGRRARVRGSGPTLRSALCGLALGALLAGSLPSAIGATANIAVASSFRPTLDLLAPHFREATGHRLRITGGASGTLTAMVLAGAPMDILLAADKERPLALERAGLVVPGSRFTYAEGRLALLAGEGLPDFGEEAPQAIVRLLQKPGDWHLAIANPELAPYGLAAWQLLGRLGLQKAAEKRLARGSNAGQALQFVVGGGAAAGLVALSQARLVAPPGRYLAIPSSLHPPIEQQAVLLRRGADNPAARALMQFLREKRVIKLLVAEGYQVPAGIPAES